MAESWVALAVLVAFTSAVVAVLVRAGAFLSPEAVTIRRVRQRMGTRRGVVGGVLDRAGLNELVRRQLGIRRMLLACGRGADARVFVERCVRTAVVALAIVVAGDAASLVSGNGLLLAPYWLLVVAVAGVLRKYVDLVTTARRRRRQADRALTKMLLVFGLSDTLPVASATHLSPSDPMLALAGAQRSPALREMLLQDDWRALGEAAPRSRVALLEELERVYEVGMFRRLARVVDSVASRGAGDPAAEYVALARAQTEMRHADAEVRLRSRSIAVLFPGVGLLFILLVFIFSAIAYTSANGGVL